MSDSAAAQNLDRCETSAADLSRGAEAASESGRGWIWKTLASVWLLYHLCGIVLAPATVPPSPELFRRMYPVFGPYLQLINLNQGNHFFAPDPTAGTVVSYVVETADGRSLRGQIPSRDTFPRLLYHRRFMLTESLAGADYLDPRVRERLTRAMARELLQRPGGRSVRLSRVTHELAGIEQVRAGISLDAPELTVEEPLGRFEWTDFFE